MTPLQCPTCRPGLASVMAGKGSELALRRVGRTRGRARERASGDERVVDDNGGARLEKLLAEPNRVRCVENIREGGAFNLTAPQDSAWRVPNARGAWEAGYWD
jgi:hypothetical protein